MFELLRICFADRLAPPQTLGVQVINLLLESQNLGCLLSNLEPLSFDETEE